MSISRILFVVPSAMLNIKDKKKFYLNFTLLSNQYNPLMLMTLFHTVIYR